MQWSVFSSAIPLKVYTYFGMYTLYTQAPLLQIDGLTPNAFVGLVLSQNRQITR